jgi:hypothetical protein
MARNVRLDDRAADAGAGISDMSPNSVGKCESPSKASIAAMMIRIRYSPSSRGARAGAGDALFTVVAEVILDRDRFGNI